MNEQQRRDTAVTGPAVRAGGRMDGGRATGEAVLVDGVPVRGVTLAGLVDEIVGLTRTSGTDVLVGVNAHVTNLARHDPELRRFLAGTTLNYPDGQSVLWAAHLLGTDMPERVATTDLALPLVAAAARAGLPLYFYGGRPGVAERAAARMREHAPTADIRVSHGYVRDEAALLRDIDAHGTRILLVGLGDPLQERWVARHRGELPPVVLTCGGLFDWLSGEHRRAPEWMIHRGLEWLWRLMIEPRRLARRYLLGNPAFVAAVLRQWAGQVRGTRARRPLAGIPA